MTITLQMMRDVLQGQRKADEAIFWWCHAWHHGPKSDLYRAMVETNFHPDFHRQRQIDNDPEILFAWEVLGRSFGKQAEAPMCPVKLSDVQENDVRWSRAKDFSARIPAQVWRAFCVHPEGLAVPGVQMARLAWRRLCRRSPRQTIPHP